MARLGPMQIMTVLGRAAIIVALGCTACGARSVAPLPTGDAAPLDTPPPTTNTMDAAAVADASVPGGDSGAVTDTTATVPVSPVDRDIAAVMQSLNNGEIAAAEVAQTRASTPAVREFATRMATEHRASNQQLATLLGRLGIVPTANNVSAQIDAASTADVQQLGTFSGIQFDRAYASHQAFVHAQALELLDAVLIPQVQNPELRAFLVTTRATIQTHLTQAEALQTALGPA